MEKGKIIIYKRNAQGKYYGFIERDGKENIYFNLESLKNEEDKEYLKPKVDVVFNVKRNKRSNRDQVVDLRIMKRYLPRDNKMVSPIDEIDNFNLLLNKYPQFIIKDGFNFFLNGKGDPIINIGEKFSFDTSNTANISTISEKYKQSIKNMGLNTNKGLTLKPDYRLIVGLGDESVYETSITLHHIYGFPYIPGQAVKGVVSSWFIKNEFDKFLAENNNVKYEQILCLEKLFETYVFSNKKTEDERKKEEKYNEEIGNFKVNNIDMDNCLFNYLSSHKETIVKEYQTVFGTQNRKGKFIFFDAYPKGKITLKNDIMTPHYGPYYSDKKPPADYHSPNPIPFLTVEETKFEFFIGSNKDEELVKEVNGWLKSALTEHGIGAKTAIGYGSFK